MAKTFDIVIQAVQKGFDSAKSAIVSAIGGGSDEAKTKVAALKAELELLDKEYQAIESTLQKVEGFKKLKAEAEALEAEWKAMAVKAAQLAQEIRTTDGDTKKLSDAFRVTQSEAKLLEAQFTKKVVSLNKLDDQLIKAGFDTKNFAASEQTLTEKLNTNIAAVDKNTAALKTAEGTSVGFFDKLKTSSSSALDGLRSNLASTAAQLVGMYLSFQGISKVTSIVRESESAMFNLESSVAAANREFDNTGSVDDWKGAISRLSAAMKIYSDSDIANAISRTVDMTKRLGLEKEQMEEVIKRSADLGAGKVELTGAIERVTAALRGEAESSEYLGLTLNENYVKAWHEAHNAHEVAWKDLSDIEKAQVRYNVFLEQSSEMQGRAANSAKTFSGMLAGTSAEFNNIIAKSPSVQSAMSGVTQSIETNRPALKNLVEGLAILGGGIINIGVYILDLVNRGFGLLAGGIEKVASVVTIGALNIKKAWANIFGTDEEVKAIQRQIDAEKAFLKVINDTIEGFKNSQKAGAEASAESVKASETKAEAEAKAAEKIKKAHEEKTEAIKKKRLEDLDLALKNLDRETAAQDSAFKQQVANIKLAMAEKRITQEEGAAQIADMERKAAEQRVKDFKAALAKETELTGDEYNKRADQRAGLTQQLADAELDLTNIQIREAEARNQVEADAAKKRADLAQAEIDATKKAEAEKTAALKDSYDKKVVQWGQETLIAGQELDLQLQRIREMEREGVISHDEAIAQKVNAERAYSDKKVELAKQAAAAALEAYGEGSAEYLAAMADMKAATESQTQAIAWQGEAMKNVQKAASEWRDTWLAAVGDGNTTLKEFNAEMERLNLIYGEGRANGEVFGHMVTLVRDEINQTTVKIKQLGEMARDVFGVTLDLDNLTLNGAVAAVQGLIDKYRDLSAQLLETKEKAGDIDIDFEEWKQGFSDTESVSAAFNRSLETLRTAVNNLKDDTGDVSSAYSDVVGTGQASIDALKAQWEDLGATVKKIEAMILGVHAETASSILELQRKQMTEEELFLSQRKEMHDAFNEALRLSNAGNVEAASELFTKARELAKTTAVEVKGVNGEILQTQAQTTAQSIAMINQIEAAQVGGLERFKTTIEQQQTGIMGVIESVMNKLETVLDRVLNTINGRIQVSQDKLAELMKNINAYYNRDESPSPLPKLARGGILSGPTHAQGGILVEAENKELFVSADSTSKIISKYGMAGIRSILNGDLPRFDLGGMVTAGLQNTLPSVPKFADGGMVSAATFGQVKDMGVTDLNFDGKAYPVAAKIDVLAELQSAINRKKRLRSN